MQISDALKKAIFNSLLGKYSLYAIQIASLMVLARLFSPEEFGVIAAAQVFLVFFQMLAVSGLAPAIVYQEKVPANMRDGIFSFTLILGFILALIFLLLSKPIYFFLELETGLLAFYALPVCVFFSAIAMIPVASLQKDAKFLTIARAEIFSEVISFSTCILLSFYLDGIIALSIKFVMTPIFRFIFYYLFSNSTTIGRANFGKDIGKIKLLVGYAKYQVAFNILNFFSRNLDNLLIAKYFGIGVLGVYEKTYQVMRYPLQLFTFAITPALQPILTKYKSEKETVYKEYSIVALRLALIGAYSSTVLFQQAKEVIFILFGSQWFAAAAFLKILSLAIPLQMVMSSTGGLFQAFGETKAMFICGLFSSFLTITAIISGVYYSDILLMCHLLVGAFFINYIQCFYMVHKSIFTSQSANRSIVIGFFACIGFINILFDTTDEIPVTDYINALISTGTTSLLASLPFLAIYFLLKKIGY